MPFTRDFGRLELFTARVIGFSSRESRRPNTATPWWELTGGSDSVTRRIPPGTHAPRSGANLRLPRPGRRFAIPAVHPRAIAITRRLGDTLPGHRCPATR
jgi:hypothetical protein